MNGDSKAEVGRDAVRDVGPRLAAVIGAVKAPVVLQEHPLRARLRLRHLVDALAELRMLVWEEVGADALVRRPPAFARVFRHVHAGGRDRHTNARRVARIEQDRVQAQPAAARLPLRPLRMIPEPFDEVPRIARIGRLEQRRRLDAAVDRVRFRIASGDDLPDILQRCFRAFGKAYVRHFRIGPVLAEIVARPQQRSPMHAGRSGPDAVASEAAVVSHAVDRAAGEVRPADLPLFARLAGAEDERAFHRPDHQDDVAFLRLHMVCNGHQFLLSIPSVPRTRDCSALRYARPRALNRPDCHRTATSEITSSSAPISTTTPTSKPTS